MLYEALGANVVSKITGHSTDTYWSIKDPEVAADFIRIRDLDDDSYQITVKGKDRDINENRLEIDIESYSQGTKIHKLIQSAFGAPAGHLTKHYHVYWPTSSKHLTVSCYQVQGDPRVFVEVETTSASSLDEWEGLVSGGFEKHNMSMERAPGSLYEMFILAGYKL